MRFYSPRVSSGVVIRNLTVWKKHGGLRPVCCAMLLGVLAAGDLWASDAIDEAANIAGLPRSIIERIIKRESGGYPYSLNTNSQLGSFRFKSRKAAEAALQALIAKGYTNIDVGAAQVNLRWHPDLYDHPFDLLDPRKNIIAAGHVLKKNKASGAVSTRDVVGRYHSSRPHLAESYADMVLGSNIPQ